MPYVMIAEPSVQSLFLVAMCNGMELGTGTGFIVEQNGTQYLVSNYHVVAGRDPSTGQPRHESGATPDTVRVVYLLPPTTGRLEWEPRDERVIDLESGEARWLEHKVYGRQVDVVALPLTSTNGAEIHPYDISGRAPAIRVGPSEGVSVVGFPFGRTAGGAFGIWTRGFIASEPEYDFDDLPCFLIDARTRPGQSGSPVIAYSLGGLTPMADGSAAFFSGPLVNLLGVYSGRLNEESDLGLVWKSRVIGEIIRDGTPGRDAP